MFSSHVKHGCQLVRGHGPIEAKDLRELDIERCYDHAEGVVGGDKFKPCASRTIPFCVNVFRINDESAPLNGLAVDAHSKDGITIGNRRGDIVESPSRCSANVLMIGVVTSLFVLRTGKVNGAEGPCNTIKPSIPILTAFAVVSSMS